ncbi:hypothetical protein Tco_0617624 [Tanacetum coccineum]
MTTSQQSAAMSERIGTLERDNMRLKGMLGVERQRFDRLQCSMSTMSTATCFGMTQDAINKLIAKCMEEALQAYDAVKNPEPKQKWRMSNKTTMSRSMVIMETVMGMETLT